VNRYGAVAIVNRLRKSECLDHPAGQKKVAVVERWLLCPTKKRSENNTTFKNIDL